MQIQPALCAAYLGMDANFWQRAAAALDWINEDAAAQSIFLQARQLLMDRQNTERTIVACTALREHATAFAPAHVHMVLAALLGHCLPAALAQMEAEGIPEAVQRDTLRDFAIWAGNYQAEHGVPGIWEVHWCILFFAGRIYKLGRMQYEKIIFTEPYYIYRHNNSGKLAVVAKAGLGVAQDGRLAGTNGRRAAAFTTALRAEGGVLYGTQADTRAATLRAEPEALALTEHTLLLAPGMPVLNLHIPATGPLLPAEVAESLAQAKVFFEERGFPTEIGVCRSWLLDVCLAQFLDEENNSVQFMRRFKKYPVLAPEPMIGGIVFGRDFTWPNWAQVPQKTRMQRALKAHLEAGGEVFDTGGVLCF